MECGAIDDLWLALARSQYADRLRAAGVVQQVRQSLRDESRPQPQRAQRREK